MKHQFKTNINCGNCIQSISPFLNLELEIEHWEVDTENPDKILTVETDLSTQQIEAIVEGAGFKIERVPN